MRQRSHRRHDRPHPERRRCASAPRCSTPGLEAARARARRAAGRGLHPRLFAWSRSPASFPEFEIELKYFDGEPVIAEIARVSKPGRRVYSSIARPEAGQERPRHLDPVDAQGRDVRHRRPRRQRRRRSPLPRLLEPCRVSARSPSPIPSGVTVDARRPDRHGEGPQGPARLDRGRRDRGRAGGRRSCTFDAARRHASARAPCGACRAPWSHNMVAGRHRRATRRRWSWSASAIAPR